MQYDPIKKQLGQVFNRTPFLRKLFYRMLDLLLLRTWHVKKEIREWSKTADKKSHILDAGSGFGQYTYFFSRLSNHWRITGVDVKEEQIEDCNRFFDKTGKSSHVNFKYADLVKFSETNAYDLILSVDVMEHILEDRKVFENFYKALKPGGMLLISTPSDKGGSDVHDESDQSFIDEHVRDGYEINDISEKLIGAGFKNVNAKYSYGKPGKISWKLSMKYPILMLNVSKLFFIILPFYYLVTFPFCLVLNRLDVTTDHQEGTGLVVKAIK